MKKNIGCAMIMMALATGSLCARADNAYIGNWALTIPGGGAGWLGITQEQGGLKGGILWGGGSVKPVDSIQIEGEKLVVSLQARNLIPYLADAVPGWFQTVVSLHDARGRELAFADDYRFDPDPVIFYKIPNCCLICRALSIKIEVIIIL